MASSPERPTDSAPTPERSLEARWAKRLEPLELIKAEHPSALQLIDWVKEQDATLQREGHFTAEDSDDKKEVWIRVYQSIADNLAKLNPVMTAFFNGKGKISDEIKTDIGRDKYSSDVVELFAGCQSILKERYASYDPSDTKPYGDKIPHLPEEYPTTVTEFYRTGFGFAIPLIFKLGVLDSQDHRQLDDRQRRASTAVYGLPHREILSPGIAKVNPQPPPKFGELYWLPRFVNNPENIGVSVEVYNFLVELVGLLKNQKNYARADQDTARSFFERIKSLGLAKEEGRKVIFRGTKGMFMSKKDLIAAVLASQNPPPPPVIVEAPQPPIEPRRPEPKALPVVAEPAVVEEIPGTLSSATTAEATPAPVRRWYKLDGRPETFGVNASKAKNYNPKGAEGERLFASARRLGLLKIENERSKFPDYKIPEGMSLVDVIEAVYEDEKAAEAIKQRPEEAEKAVSAAEAKKREYTHLELQEAIRGALIGRGLSLEGDAIGRVFEGMIISDLFLKSSDPSKLRFKADTLEKAMEPYLQKESSRQAANKPPPPETKPQTPPNRVPWWKRMFGG